MLTTNFHKDFTLTQRPLTAAELEDAKVAYQVNGRMRWLGDTYHLNMLLPQIADVISNRTTDGKPLRSERVPTAADIGKRVKVRGWETQAWQRGSAFVGFSVESHFAVQMTDGTIGIWKYCIIDEEAAQ
jgi:hypothetical protein